MIKIIAKAVRIMNLFSATDPRLSVSEVARRMEIPKSTAHNILKSLAAEALSSAAARTLMPWAPGS